VSKCAWQDEQRGLLVARRFNTDEYEFNHGARPRGRGTWAFGFGEREPAEPFYVSALYSEAKREALREAKRRGFSGMIFVLP